MKFSQTRAGGVLICQITAELDYLKTTWRLTKMEEKEFQSATYATVEDAIREMQLEQERTQDLMYMQRLEPFLLSMQQFGEIANIIEIFSDAQHAMAYVWVCPLIGCGFHYVLISYKGPMKYVLCVRGSFPASMALPADITTQYRPRPGILKHSTVSWMLTKKLEK